MRGPSGRLINPPPVLLAMQCVGVWTGLTVLVGSVVKGSVSELYSTLYSIHGASSGSCPDELLVERA